MNLMLTCALWAALYIQCFECGKRLKARVAALEERLEQLTQNVGTGSVYVRWGNDECPETGAELIYRGYAAGPGWDQGGGSNLLCLPENPTWLDYESAYDEGHSYIYGAEYGTGAMADILGPNKVFADMRCAVCKIPRSVTYMFPGFGTCLPGWTQEYSGYLVSGIRNHSVNIEYNCLDRYSKLDQQEKTREGDCLLYFVNPKCGPLPCPPYVEVGELNCAVCSK